jgi:NitT/TauT family transport system substrate-binding protein
MHRNFHGIAAMAFSALCLALAFVAVPGRSDAEELILTEPVHGVSFLPIYVAQRKGYFKDEGIDLTITTMSGGNAFVNAALTGQAFAFIGSVDHNAFARANGKDVKAVSNLVAHANIYMMARSDLMPVTGELAAVLKGKRIAVGNYGRTPNNVLRYLLLTKWNLAPARDVTLVEVDANLIHTAVGTRQAEFGVTNEPFISIGVRQKIWGQPIFNAATEFGPYADTAVSVLGESIEKAPLRTRGLVRAVVRGLIYLNAHQDEMLAFARTEFPTASPEDLQAALSRAFADKVYSTDGFIPQEAWSTGEAVVLRAGILKRPVSYDEVVDMRFVNEVRKELGIQ